MHNLKKILDSCQFESKTIIDIGVRNGTPELYECFPDSFFYLIDPQPEAEAGVLHKPNKFKFINVALGSKPGRLKLTNEGGKSTVLQRTALSGGEVKCRTTVPVVCFEYLLSSESIKGPIGVKIDTEGFESEVLKGFGSAFSITEFFIIECNILERFKNSYFFSEIIGILADNGFEFVCQINNIGKINRFIDALFVRRDSAIIPISSKEAEERLQKDLLLDSENADLHYKMGLVLERQASHEEAERHYRKAKETGGRENRYITALGRMALQRKSYSEVVNLTIGSYDENEDNFPWDDFEMVSILYQAYRGLSLPDRASASLRRAHEKGRRPLSLKLIEIAISHEDGATALSLVSEMRAVTADDPELWRLGSLAHQTLGDMSTALAEAEKAAELGQYKPRYTKLLRNIGRK